MQANDELGVDGRGVAVVSCACACTHSATTKTGHTSRTGHLPVRLEGVMRTTVMRLWVCPCTVPRPGRGVEPGGGGKEQALLHHSAQLLHVVGSGGDDVMGDATTCTPRRAYTAHATTACAESMRTSSAAILVRIDILALAPQPAVSRAWGMWVFYSLLYNEYIMSLPK